MKFVSKALGTHVPLLQSTMKQMGGAMLGVGDGRKGIGISQNTPVHSGKHTQTTVSFSTHSPLVQLMKSHRVGVSGVGEGDVEGIGEVDKARNELEVWTTEVEKPAALKFSELSETLKRNDDVIDETAAVGVRVRIGDGISDVKDTVSVAELGGTTLGENTLIDCVNSDVDIGLRRTSDVTVAVGDTGITELGINEEVKIGRRLELVSGGKERGVKTLMDSESSDVGKGMRTSVVLTRVGVGAAVLTISLTSDDRVKSIPSDVIEGRGLSTSKELTERRKVCVGRISMEELSNDDKIATDVSISIVEAMLKDNLDVEGVGVISITTAVVSSMGSSLTELLLISREGRPIEKGLLLALMTGLCRGLLLILMKGRSVLLLLIVTKGIRVCGSIISTDENWTIDDDSDTPLCIGKLLEGG